MITIIRKGIAEIPSEAFTCSVCGTYVAVYKLEKKVNIRPWCEQQCVSVGEPPLLPTFNCQHCASIWQYKPDAPEINADERAD